MSWWRRLWSRESPSDAAPIAAAEADRPWVVAAGEVGSDGLADFVAGLDAAEPAEQVAALRRCRVRLGDDPVICLALARRRVEESATLWRVLTGWPEHAAEAWGALAEVALAQGDRPEAATLAQRSLGHAPGDPARLKRALALADALPGLPPVAVATLAPTSLRATPASERVPPGLRLGERLGAGGFGVVYSARDESLQRDVAIKFLHPHHLRAPAIRAAFAQEAQTLARLDHPGFARVFDVDPGQGTITMARYEGSLRARLDVGARLDGPGLALVIARSLAALHDLGLVHADLKPDNILMDRLGRPVLTDLSAGAAALGTAGWRAPEQDARPGPAVDVYAFGRLLGVLEVDPALAADCLAADPSARPKMAHVVARLLSSA